MLCSLLRMEFMVCTKMCKKRGKENTWKKFEKKVEFLMDSIWWRIMSSAVGGWPSDTSLLCYPIVSYWQNHNISCNFSSSLTVCSIDTPNWSIKTKLMMIPHDDDRPTKRGLSLSPSSNDFLLFTRLHLPAPSIFPSLNASFYASDWGDGFARGSFCALQMIFCT